ncbi:MAG: hypothetical protein Pg6C_13260 [Treponemataceae bacterium]|nr:MAG: hypothetical protein Pg6C_13260 [Treponemataceae bacterium]
MRTKRYIAMMACAAALCALAHSLPFTFQIAQFDRARTAVSESSFEFEDIIFSYFFEAGYIVSNLPAATIDNPDNVPVAQAMRIAREGSLDYLAIVVLVYDRSQSVSDAPQSALWKLYRVSDEQMLCSGIIIAKDVAGNDAAAKLKNCARNISHDMDSALKKI